MLRPMTFPAIVFLCLTNMVFAEETAANTAIIAPAPEGEKLSEDFQITVNAQNVPVYLCRVSAVPLNQVWPGYQRPIDQTELASLAYWDMSGPVEVDVVSRQPIQSVSVRPLSLGIVPKVEGNHIRFQITTPRPVMVEVNGAHNVLHLFPNPPESNIPDPNAPGVRFYGPGVHHTGRIKMADNETVYIAPGAVVYGEIEALKAKNVRILGRGILDSSEFTREHGVGNIQLANSRDVVIDGVILRDPSWWSLNIFSSSNIHISNVKLVGLWRYNADGIDVCDSQNVVIENSFVRAFDDCIVAKGITNTLPVKQVSVKGCTLWNDWGRAFEIGAETSAPEISDITYSDCDILRATHIAIDIQHGDNAKIKNILYDNIRIEIEDPSYAPQYQNAKDEKYRPDTNYLPKLLVIEIRKNNYNTSPTQGTVENVVLRNISVVGKTLPTSSISGYDPEYQVKDVVIENLRFNDRVLNNAEEASISIGSFAEGIRFAAPSATP